MASETHFPIYSGLTRDHVTDWVLHDSKLERRATPVAFVIAWHYNPDLHGTIMSHSTVAEHMNSVTVTVARAIPLLAESGEWVIVDRVGASGENLPSLYVPVLGDKLPEGVKVIGFGTPYETEAGTVIRVTLTDDEPQPVEGGVR